MNSTFNLYVKSLQFLRKNILKYAQISSFFSTFVKAVDKINIKLLKRAVDFSKINYDDVNHMIQSSILSANIIKSVDDMFID